MLILCIRDTRNLFITETLSCDFALPSLINRPVYSQIQIRAHFLNFFIEKSIFISFPFAFSENNLKTASTQLPEKKKKANAHTLQKKYKPWEFRVKTTQRAIQQQTLLQWEVTRLIHVLLKTQIWFILDWKTNKLQNMSRNLYDQISFKFL